MRRQTEVCGAGPRRPADDLAPAQRCIERSSRHSLYQQRGQTHDDRMYLIPGRPHGRLTDRRQAGKTWQKPPETFGHYTLSAVSVMEIVRGFQKNQSFRKLQAFVASLAAEEIIAFDQADGELAGRIAGC
jgi:hypothetical protein